MLAVVSAIYAQPQSAVPAGGEVKKPVVSGRVVTVTGQPLRKAIVRASPPGTPANQNVAVETDAEGKFELKDLEPGAYQLSAQKSGYLQQAYGARRFGQAGSPLRLTSGQEVKEIEIRLTEAATISGRVLDEDGEPFSGNSMVMAMQQKYQNGRRQWVPLGVAMASGNQYSLGNLPPGRYVVLVNPMVPPGPTRSADGVERQYAATYYNRATDAASAILLDVAPGQQLTAMDITMEKVRVFRVRGKIAGEGTPASVMATSIGQDMMSSFLPRGSAAVRGEDRSFELALPPGSYRLQGATQVLGGEAWGPVEVTVEDQNIEGVMLSKAVPLSFTGRIVLKDWTGKSKVSSLNLRLRPEEFSMTTLMAMAAPIKVSESGEFKVEKASPGRYTVDITNLPDGAYIKSVRVGQSEAAGRRFEVTSAPAPVELTVSGKAARLEGTVRLEMQAAMPHAQVVLVPGASLRQDDSAYLTASAGADGSFTFTRVPPGEYKVLAWEDIDPGSWCDPEVLAKFESRAVSVSLAEGESKSVAIDGIPAGATDAHR